MIHASKLTHSKNKKEQYIGGLTKNEGGLTKTRVKR